VSDPVALLMVDEAFPSGGIGDVAKIGVLAGSIIAAAVGVAVLLTSPPAATPADLPERIGATD
jgi:Na+/H+ antiporter NhaA